MPSSPLPEASMTLTGSSGINCDTSHTRQGMSRADLEIFFQDNIFLEAASDASSSTLPGSSGSWKNRHSLADGSITSMGSTHFGSCATKSSHSAEGTQIPCRMETAPHSRLGDVMCGIPSAQHRFPRPSRLSRGIAGSAWHGIRNPWTTGPSSSIPPSIRSLFCPKGRRRKFAQLSECLLASEDWTFYRWQADDQLKQLNGHPVQLSPLLSRTLEDLGGVQTISLNMTAHTAKVGGIPGLIKTLGMAALPDRGYPPLWINPLTRAAPFTRDGKSRRVTSSPTTRSAQPRSSYASAQTPTSSGASGTSAQQG